MRVDLSAEDAATVVRALSHAGPPADRIAKLFEPVERLTAELKPRDEDGALVPTCPACGGQTFGYEENTIEYRFPSGNDPEHGVVGVVWDVGCSADSGDGDPGLFCDHYRGAGCGAPIDLPDGWEIEYL